jgi:hypothetical protein
VTGRPAPTEIGATSIALSFSVASTSSGSVAGVPAMPACSNRSLLYQMPVMPNEKGMAYCVPSTSQGFTTPPKVEISSARGSVRSFR